MWLVDMNFPSPLFYICYGKKINLFLSVYLMFTDLIIQFAFIYWEFMLQEGFLSLWRGTNAGLALAVPTVSSIVAQILFLLC